MNKPTVTFKLSKLVRDKMPELFEELNHSAKSRRLEGADLVKALKAKVVEEASELAQTNPTAQIDELAELSDVLQALQDTAAACGLTMEQVETARETKLAAKGGFGHGIFVDTVSISADDEKWLARYRADPERFPEVAGTGLITTHSIVALSDLLGEMGAIKRATLLPSGEPESDSHHSFMLALTAYDICSQHCPELNLSKIVLFALVHDLAEIITGDEDTLLLDRASLQAKHERDKAALHEIEQRLANHPALLVALHEYERLDTPESAFVFVLDKACTIWTHFHDNGSSLHSRGATTRAIIDEWYSKQIEKIQNRLKIVPPQVVLDIFSESHNALRKELFNK